MENCLKAVYQPLDLYPGGCRMASRNVIVRNLTAVEGLGSCTLRPALFVPENWGGHQLLNSFMAERQYLAVVQDSSHHVVGVVTLEDVLEYLLDKPIVGEHDTHPEMQRLARERLRWRSPPAETSNE